MSDPVSWLMIERGWSVVGAGGDELGRVHEVLGDEEHDIFDGLNVSSGLLARPHYVAAERVGEIEQGRVHVDLAELPQSS